MGTNAIGSTHKVNAMPKKDIEYWKEILNKFPDTRLQSRRFDVLADIDFLESIYMTGGKYNHFGQAFKDAAYNERQELCQLSSAIYSVIREREAAAAQPTEA